jgi:hypothetical protein
MADTGGRDGKGGKGSKRSPRRTRVKRGARSTRSKRSPRSTSKPAPGRKPAGRSAASPRAPKSATAVATITARLKGAQARVASLERQISRLQKQRAAEQRMQRRRVASARRQSEAQLTRMVQEIGQLRLHEARVRALERMLAEHGIDASPQALAATRASRSRATDDRPDVAEHAPDD